MRHLIAATLNIWNKSGPWIEREVSGGSGVFELGAAREHVEASDVVVELGARERAARVDELDLADDAFVALAARDAKCSACGVGSRRCRRQGVLRGG